MSNETSITVITPKSLDEVRTLSTTLAKSTLLPEALRGKEAEIMFSILTGAELGLAPMQSIRAIEVIKGKPTLKAEAMVALVRARRDVCEYFMLRHSDSKRATFETKRVGDPSPTTMSFTIEDAQAAGLASGDNWKKYAPAMLRARASSAICKAVYSDILLGIYDPDELSDVATPRASPPSNVIDSTATVVTDYAADGAPLSERAKLDVAISEAQDKEALAALVPRITRLPESDKAAVRLSYGARLAELTAPSRPPVVAVVTQREPGMEG